MHLGENLQTTCLHCGAVFRVTQQQLDAAHGQARCSQCHQVFNALLTLDNLSPNADLFEHADKTPPEHSAQSPQAIADSEASERLAERQLSLNEAMYGNGQKRSNRSGLKPALWMLGILLLVIVSLVQYIYYQRYSLIASESYQQQILNMCRLLPCDASRFTSLSQIKLLERNVFTHPTRDKALMISGAFINKAPFEQSIPGLLISLSDLKGNLIGNRLFSPAEYLVDKTLDKLPSNKPIQFRLEIADPATQALTYEFEFVNE